ncbi:MAG: hypothetical protein MSA07_07665 [Mucispirillum sp.]|nr:hypothetical protein [Mucispirillum sp.]
MYRNIILLILLPVLLISCSNSDNGVNYDYTDTDNTTGLVVSPSNTLQFQDKNLGDVLKFNLYFSPAQLTPIGIDPESVNYGTSFENNPPFDPVACLSEAADFGYCTLSIKMLNTAKEGDSGSINIMFFYNEDTIDESINKVKYHTLKFIYSNKLLQENPGSDNATGGTNTDGTNTDNTQNQGGTAGENENSGNTEGGSSSQTTPAT